MDWYLVLTKPRQERVALDNLQRQGYAAFLPTVRSEQLRRGRISQQALPMFPRYLFVELDSGAQGRSWSPIRSTRGVSTLVHFGLQPARVDRAIVAHLRQRQDELEGQGPAGYFQPGQMLTVTDGPFAGLDAVFSMADGERRVVVLLELMSRTVRASIDVAALRKVA